MYLKNISAPRRRHGLEALSTAQTQKAAPSQILNAAGGYTFEVDPWARLDRFLVIGTEGGTYYAGERELTLENAKVVVKLLAENGRRVVDRIVEISDSGRAAKNDTALFALALAASVATAEVRSYALSKLNQVARTGSAITQFVSYAEQFRGWGRQFKNAVADWYLSKDADQLAYQLTKYQNRNGYSQRDILRLAKPVGNLAENRPFVNDVLHYVAKGELSINAPALLHVIEEIKANPNKIRLDLIREHRLAREVLPTEWLQNKEVWEALLENMPMTAMVRNLATMTKLGLITERSEATQKIVRELENTDRIRKARIHPMNILVAARTYNQGRGLRGSATWIPSNAIVGALDKAFYLAFGNVEPTNRRTLVALDLSGSMTSSYGVNYGSGVMGIPGFSPREATAALALIQINIEPNIDVMGFSSGISSARYLQIGKEQALERVLQYLNSLPSGGTDLSLPLQFARMNLNSRYESIVVYTDNETWAGRNHPFEALRDYRNANGVNTKLATVSVTATANRITEPKDENSMDFIGFDSSTPMALTEFLR